MKFLLPVACVLAAATSLASANEPASLKRGELLRAGGIQLGVTTYDQVRQLHIKHKDPAKDVIRTGAYALAIGDSIIPCKMAFKARKVSNLACLLDDMRFSEIGESQKIYDQLKRILAIEFDVPGNEVKIATQDRAGATATAWRDSRGAILMISNKDLVNNTKTGTLFLMSQ